MFYVICVQGVNLKNHKPRTIQGNLLTFTNAETQGSLLCAPCWVDFVPHQRLTGLNALCSFLVWVSAWMDNTLTYCFNTKSELFLSRPSIHLFIMWHQYNVQCHNSYFGTCTECRTCDLTTMWCHVNEQCHVNTHLQTSTVLATRTHNTFQSHSNMNNGNRYCWYIVDMSPIICFVILMLSYFWFLHATFKYICQGLGSITRTNVTWSHHIHVHVYVSTFIRLGHQQLKNNVNTVKYD